MIPFPAEIITLLGSTLLGSFLKIWGAKQAYQADLNKYMLSLNKAVSTSQKEAREFRGRGFQWTRRIIALSVVLSVIVLPKALVLYDPNISVIFGWTALHPGFLFMPDKSVMEWQSMRGLVITPLDTQMVSAIIGLYFGGSLAGHHR